MRIAICLADNHPYFQRQFVFSTWRLQQAFYTNPKMKKHELCILRHGGFQLDKMRDAVVEMAIKAGMTHLLLLDTDMDFPEYLIPRMVGVMEENKGTECVTGVYTWRTPPYLPHLFDNFNKKTGRYNIKIGFPIDKVFKVEAAGAGCLFIKASVFKRVKKPWFRFVEKGEDKRIPDGMGEDLHFFWKCKPKMLADSFIHPGHYDTRPVDLGSYLRYNGIELDKKGFMKLTQEKALKIEQEHLNRRKK